MKHGAVNSITVHKNQYMCTHSTGIKMSRALNIINGPNESVPLYALNLMHDTFTRILRITYVGFEWERMSNLQKTDTHDEEHI